ncbi:MAG TPA: DegT/DnrJ/EryC1/StrS family aminotransferase [Chthoniobacterales bacterium]
MLPRKETQTRKDYLYLDKHIGKLAATIAISENLRHPPAVKGRLHGETSPSKAGYLENKPPNHQRVKELLGLSAKANHWANGGPVSCLLEEQIAEITQLHPERTVVGCANGTAALNILAGLHAMKRGRALRWVVSGYSFFSCFIGPFAGSLVIDCDDEGMLDLDKLSALPTGDYDGVCVTNLFGLHPDLRRYEDFCRERGKALIVDNAQGFFCVDRSRPDCPDEIISFHHTKPWGFGEGGCVLVSEEDEAIVRSIINFGVSLPDSAAPWVFNGKMSDVAAAYIVDRLERIPNWLPQYKTQRHRLTLEVLDRTNLTLLSPDRHPFPGTGNIPFLAPRPIDPDQLENDFIALRKYYRPPTNPALVKAHDLFARIVNIPCHREIAALRPEAIHQALEVIFGDSN